MGGVRQEAASEVVARGQTDPGPEKTGSVWGHKSGGLSIGAQAHQGQVQTMEQSRNDHITHWRDGPSRVPNCRAVGRCPSATGERTCRQEEGWVDPWLFRVKILVLGKMGLGQQTNVDQNTYTYSEPPGDPVPRRKY